MGGTYKVRKSTVGTDLTSLTVTSGRSESTRTMGVPADEGGTADRQVGVAPDPRRGLGRFDAIGLCP